MKKASRSATPKWTPSTSPAMRSIRNGTTQSNPASSPNRSRYCAGRPYQAAVDQAQASLSSAQATERNAALALQRSQELIKTNATPQATVDQNVANQATGLGEDGRYLR